MSGHTPGPWQVVAKGPWICGPAGETVALVQKVAGTIAAESPANARLIAAAPELLEAAKDISAMHRGGPQAVGNWDASFSQLDAAIAKAEGR